MSDTQTLPDLVSSGESIADVYLLNMECPTCSELKLAIVKTSKDIQDGATQLAEKCLSCGYVSTTRAWMGPSMPVTL
jgi:uncharacterized Zn finger protein